MDKPIRSIYFYEDAPTEGLVILSPHDKFYSEPREATEIANRMEESSRYAPDSIHYIEGGEL